MLENAPLNDLANQFRRQVESGQERTIESGEKLSIRSEAMQCSCGSRGDLVEIGHHYAEFVAGLRCLEIGQWIKLLQCLDCGQFWRTDEWDKYQTLYALKLSSPKGWESVDIKSLIIERMVENHGGLDASFCLAKNCKLQALKGRAYCGQHFYDTGARA